MRNLTLSLIMLATLPMVGAAAVGSVTLVNDPALAFSNTYPLNLNAPPTAANRLSAQITSSSATIASQTFTDGSQSTASITVGSNNILAKQATNTITVPPTASILAAPATAQIVVSSGVPGSIISINGNQLREGHEWTSVATASGSATNLAAAINTYLPSILTAVTTGYTTIYTTTVARGSLPNSYTLTSSTPTVITTTTFSGGHDPILQNDEITFNGNVYRNGYLWTDGSGTSTGTALSIAQFLNTLGVIIASVPTNGTIVTATATLAGATGNGYTLSASAGLTVGSANFTGGQSSGSISINGVTFTAGVDFTTGTTAQTATSLAAAINSATLDGTSAAAIAAVVTTTSTLSGTSANYALTTSTPAALTLSGATMTGGTNATYSLATDLITIPNHGFTRALPVLYSTGVVAIGGLTNLTTYYVVVVDANNIGLSSTSVVAQAGRYIDLTSSTTGTTAHTYTLAPLAFSAGTGFSGKWQVSNDNAIWGDYTTTAAGIAVSSQTFTTGAPVTVSQDFGFLDYGWIRYNVLGPSAGGIALKVILNTKD